MRQTDGKRTTGQLKMTVVMLRVATLTLLGLIVTCSTPERRYRVLSTFFDGVPKPDSSQVEVTPDATSAPAVVESTYSVHAPWEQRQCELCHEVMFSNALKVEKSLLCATCHENKQVDALYIHGPANSGQCYVCHNPHRSQYPKLLVAEGNTLCGQCHSTDTFAAIELHTAEKGSDCLRCHNPHSSNNLYLLN